MNLYVGTSGYSYSEWKGSFYPADLPEKEMLRFYGERFRTVEINNTFHRMPSPTLLNGWAAEVPAGFRFGLKAPMRITHMERLQGSDDSLSYFIDVAGALRERLGPLLFQLPPNFKKDLSRLRSFLVSLPPRYYHAAFEFRNASWFDDEVFDSLKKHGVALCVADIEGGVEVPLISTADWGYLRLRREDYGVAELKKWLKFVQDQDWKDAFVYFKHEDLAKGPQLARKFLELAGGV